MCFTFIDLDIQTRGPRLLKGKTMKMSSHFIDNFSVESFPDCKNGSRYLHFKLCPLLGVGSR